MSEDEKPEEPKQPDVRELQHQVARLESRVQMLEHDKMALVNTIRVMAKVLTS